MPRMPYLWTRGIYMQCAPERELLTIQASIKKRQRGCRTPLMNADDGSPTNPHRQRTAPPMLHPIFQIARRNRREGQWSLSVNDARLWYDELPTVPLWASYMRKANEAAREMWAPPTWEQRMLLAGQFTTFLPHARTADERGELCGLFDGNRCGAIDPTAVRQDAAVHVGNGSNPAGHGDSGVAKIAVRSETKQARRLTEEEMNQVIRSRTDWRERVVVRLAWITASRWSEIAALTPKIPHWSRTGP
ncbi:hypothetical protein TCDM_12225 [Trypanosoma cruzi Dm28c]|uniref:Uncharacterized protein n=1 Tax=Trypanosoma cruzi Dm28c TaxID=1416333 RepID=V5B0V3_TRYCR|nr:hypothetical protein TCDM_12225 [Trypanosoma cruzi Dm28c]